MKKLTFLAVLLCMILVIAGCQKKHTSEQPNPVKRLVGQWVLPASTDTSKLFIEEWIFINDSTLTGSAFITNNHGSEDRLNQELLFLEKRNGAWLYIAVPDGQSRTPFSMTSATDNSLRFENPEHDFPQYIHYEWIHEDSILVEIGDTITNRSWKMYRKAE